MHVTEQPKNMREEKSPIIPRHCGRILPENQRVILFVLMAPHLGRLDGK